MLQYIDNQRDVSVSRMHANAKLLKPDTTRNIHLLNIMYDQRYNHNYITAPVVRTRQALKINFRFDLVHSDIYKRSPHYIGSTLWNVLPQDIQLSESKKAFKKRIYELYSGQEL